MDKQWCQCRIVEPRITQRGDTLVCFNCGASKDLPPRIDFKWERLKKDVTEKVGRPYYESFCKEGLVNLLVQRDRELLEIWSRLRAHRDRCWYDPKEPVISTLENMFSSYLDFPRKDNQPNE